MTHAEVQQIARRTIAFAREIVVPGMSLMELRRRCERHMLALGADSFWYYGIGALVFAGDETAVSISGRDYATADRTVAADDIITIDLSPQAEGVWGDFARTIVIEAGKVAPDARSVQRQGWREGLLAEERLHRAMKAFATPETTFDALYGFINGLIRDMGYVNCDFRGNLGHSIVAHRDRRVYIEAGNHAPLSSVRYFTFEPHISLPGTAYGYKREDIYCFSAGRPVEL